MYFNLDRSQAAQADQHPPVSKLSVPSEFDEQKQPPCAEGYIQNYNDAVG